MQAALALLSLLALTTVSRINSAQRGTTSDPAAVVRFAQDYPRLAP